MNKGFLISILTLLYSIISFGQSEGTIEFEKSIHDFGGVEEGIRPNFDFEFENLSDDTVRLVSVKPGCGCTSPFWTKDPIAPGETGSIKVSYNSNHRIGMFNKPVTVTTDGDVKKVIKIRGVVYPKPIKDSNSVGNKANPVLNRDVYDFGTVELNRPYTASVEIRNDGTDTLQVLKIQSGCRCVSLTLDRVNGIPPGKMSVAKISYRPSDLEENEINTVIFTNSSVQPNVELKLKTNVVKTLIQPSLLQSSPGFGF